MGILRGLRNVNRKLGGPARLLGPVREYVEPRIRMRKFERDRQARLKKHSAAGFAYEPRADIVDRLKADGFAIIPRAIDPQILLEIRREAEARLDLGTSLLPISKDSLRTKGDRSAPAVHFTPEETRMGQRYFRTHTNYVSIANPLVACPAVVRAAFYPLLVDVSWTYLGCVPAIGGLNLRKSYANDLPEFDTLYFHVDPNSPKFLKFFFYLNDVDMQGGPFCYVRGSHRRRFPGWKSKTRWTLEEIERVYGADQVVYLTANLGDLVVADTNGFHRGTKLVSTDRFMLTVDYVIHEEMEGTQDRSKFRLPRPVFDQLAPRERAVADFLDVG